jgi:hypothetical protein
LVASSRAGSQDVDSNSTSNSVGSAVADRSQFNQLEWAHELSRPEPGCLLLAHPYMFRERQRYFYQAVILLLDHGPEGSYGIILNRPTQYKVRLAAALRRSGVRNSNKLVHLPLQMQQVLIQQVYRRNLVCSVGTLPTLFLV